jgi:hypothetical protein
MGFLMKTILVRPPPRLIHAFRQNLSGCARALAAVFVSSAKPARAIQSYWRNTITALGLLAPVQSCFWKAAAMATYSSEIPHYPPLHPIALDTFPIP